MAGTTGEATVDIVEIDGNQFFQIKVTVPADEVCVRLTVNFTSSVIVDGQPVESVDEYIYAGTDKTGDWQWMCSGIHYYYVIAGDEYGESGWHSGVPYAAEIGEESYVKKISKNVNLKLVDYETGNVLDSKNVDVYIGFPWDSGIERSCGDLKHEFMNAPNPIEWKFYLSDLCDGVSRGDDEIRNCVSYTYGFDIDGHSVDITDQSGQESENREAIVYLTKVEENIYISTKACGNCCGSSYGGSVSQWQLTIKAGSTGSVEAMPYCCHKLLRWEYVGEGEDPHGIDGSTSKNITFTGLGRVLEDNGDSDEDDRCLIERITSYNVEFERCSASGQVEKTILRDGSTGKLFMKCGKIEYGQAPQDIGCNCNCGSSQSRSLTSEPNEKNGVVSIGEDGVELNILI